MRPSDANSPFGVSHRFPENMVLIESPIRLPRKVLLRATTSRSNPLPQPDASVPPVCPQPSQRSPLAVPVVH